MKHSRYDLIQMQSLPLAAKVRMTCQRVEGWYQHWNSYRLDRKDKDPDGVYLSFSGGKDSTALLHLIRTHCLGVYDCPAVFIDTGLEYPEVRSFAIEHADEVLRSAMPFKKVIETYGYPVIGKVQARAISLLQNPSEKNAVSRNIVLTGYNRKGMYCPRFKLAQKWVALKDAPFKISDSCCGVLKKNPVKKYERKTKRAPVVATMCCESKLRERAWMHQGCNAFENARPISQPMSFWTEQDVLEYLAIKNVPYSPIYGEIKQDENGRFYNTGKQRTGCMFCAFGAHLDKSPNTFERMRLTHPKQYDFCMRPVEQGGLGMAAVLDYIGVKY